jgi:hypothetical protein
LLCGTDHDELHRYCCAALDVDEAHALGLSPERKADPPIEDLVERFAQSGVPDHLKRRFCRRLAAGGAHPNGLALLLDSDFALQAVSVLQCTVEVGEFDRFLMETVKKLPLATAP